MALFSSSHFSDLICTLNGQHSEGLFEKIRSAYAEDSRFYHNACHVEDCLSKLETFKVHAENPALIASALFYHDVVYDSRRADNEELSAVWAGEDLTAAGVDPVHIKNIQDMIRATKAHQAEDTDTRLLLDIDLSILGAPADIFAAYDDAIQKEYAWVPANDYAAGRRKVLESFLRRNRIYFTDACLELYENQARMNLSRALDELI